LGKVFTARFGAAKCQALCWILRNLASLCVAFTALFYYWGLQGLGIFTLLAGAFAFYGFRGAGVIMSTPLMGAVTTSEDMPKTLAVNSGVFYVFSMLTMLGIYFVLGFGSNVWVLAGIMVAGAICGLLSSRLIASVDEPAALRNSARKSLIPQLHGIVRDAGILRLIMANATVNMAVIMIAPISMLALKRGYGVSDHLALLYSIFLSLGSALASFVCGPLTRRFGPRQVAIAAYTLLLCTPVMWIFAPSSCVPLYCCGILLIQGSGAVCSNVSLTQYFIYTVSIEKQVAASMFLAIASYVGASLCGLLFNTLLLKFFVSPVPEFNEFRWYFGAALLILAVGMMFLKRLEPLTPVQRRKMR
jgi:Na+/melibiose symporter-like transporter